MTPLENLKAADSDIKAVVFPGGFGAAKNLSDFGFKGTDMTVDKEVQRVLQVGFSHERSRDERQRNG